MKAAALAPPAIVSIFKSSNKLMVSCSCPERCHCQVVLGAIPDALSRLKRGQLAILSSVLQIGHSHYTAVLDEGIGSTGHAFDYKEKKSEVR